MKRIFLIMALMLTAILTAQTATWTGAKTFGSTLRFLNVLQNDANTRIMSLDATGKPGWVSKSAISEASIPTLEQVLVAGTVARDFDGAGFKYTRDGNGLNEYINIKYNQIDLRTNGVNNTLMNADGFTSYNDAGSYVSLSRSSGLVLGNSNTGAAILQSNLLSNGFVLFQFPNQSGTLAVLPTQVFANNAAAIAGGLAVNQTYRTATGQVMIVF